MIFDILISNVLPLYGLIFLGFIVGKYTDLDVKPIATIIIYAILPIVMFGATATMEFTAKYFLPPFIIASISIIASTTGYLIAGKILEEGDKRQNLIGLLSVGGNATYFGVPIALAIAGKEWLGVYMVMVMPIFILDASLGYYFGVRGDFSIKESLLRVAKLPIIYGAILGFIVNAIGVEPPQLFLDYWERFTGTLIVLGMMMIGAGLSQMDKFRFDLRFFTGIALLRYILWPCLGMLWVFIDLNMLHLLPNTIHTFIILVCACPLGANTVAYATKIGLFPALTSCMVLVTTILALGFIPFMLWLQTVIF
ncbi:MAG: hypothetical protein COA45_06245 [Zetaproteobacteria bacterium]|nr:MAG: hypothetical protein COA45_06245 [Zetaproteobacteria bacterium]